MCSVWLDVAEVGWECQVGGGGWESHEGRGGWEGQGRLVMGKGRVAQLGCLAAIGRLIKT